MPKVTRASDLLSVREAVDEKGVSRQRLYVLLDQGRLTEQRVGPHRLIVRDALYEGYRADEGKAET